MPFSAARLEKVIGPVLGYHLACYTVPAADGHWGYAKICLHPPADVWHTPHALAKVAAGPCAEPSAALIAVVSRTRRLLAHRAAMRDAGNGDSDLLLLQE